MKLREVIKTPFEYKIDVLAELKKAGYSTYRLSQEKILGNSTIQKLCKNEIISIENLDKICQLLNCEIEDIIKRTK